MAPFKGRGIIPSLEEEEKLLHQGYHLVAGIDEVGRGALAGPVLAGAVILPLPLETPWLGQVRDSQELTPTRREVLARLILERALGVGLGFMSAQAVDSLGIVEATRHAMAQAVAQLPQAPHFLLIDALRLPRLELPQRSLIRGDKRCISIACAAIVAKVARDRLMVEMDQAYPGYGFARHKGYGTSEHLRCLAKLGPCPIHRRTFAPVGNCSHPLGPPLPSGEGEMK